MRAILPLLGFLAMTRAIITTPPEPKALSEFCTGLTTATSVADSAMSLKGQGAPDPEINRRRLEAINALIDISVKFKLGIEKGAESSRAGFIVAKDFIYNIEQYIAGAVRPADVKGMIRPLAKRVGELLKDAKEMHTFFGDVQTAVNRLEWKLNDDEGYISNHIANVEDEIRKERRRRKKSGLAAIGLAIIAPVFPPALGGAIAMGGVALSHDQDVQDSKSLRNVLQHSLGGVRQIKPVVEAAKRATEAQIQYWSQTLDQLGSLEATSQDWLEDPSSQWMAKKALVQWKVVLEKYSECSHKVSDAGRYIQGRLQLTN